MKKFIKKYWMLALTLLLLGVAPISSVSVQAAKKTVRMNKGSVSLYKGQSYKKLKATVFGTTKKVTWKSSKPSVVSVNKNGVLKAKKKGTATVTASIGSVKASCKVTVKNPSIKLNKKSAILYTNDSPKTLTLKATIKGASSASMKKVLDLYAKGKYTEAQKMANKLPSKANEACVRNMSSAVKKAYKAVVQSYDNIDGYYLTDIDNNGIPELIIIYGYGWMSEQDYIYTYSGGKASYCGKTYGWASGYYGYPDGNGIVRHYAIQGGEDIYLITLSGTTLNSKEIGEQRLHQYPYYVNYMKLPYLLDPHNYWKNNKYNVDLSALK